MIVAGTSTQHHWVISRVKAENHGCFIPETPGLYCSAGDKSQPAPEAAMVLAIISIGKDNKISLSLRDFSKSLSHSRVGEID